MWRGRVVLICAIAACVAAASIESSPSQIVAPSQPSQKLPPGTASISGRVIEGATGRPLPGVTVALNLLAEGSLTIPMEIPPHTGVGSGFGPHSDRATTNEHGSFIFTKVPAGSFQITPIRTGWPPIDARSPAADPVRWIDVRDGERVAGVEVRLSRPATITGRVTDDNGMPLAGVEMFATAPGTAPVAYGPLGGRLTDDRGQYSVFAQPGRNFVSTAQFPGIETSLAPSPISAFLATFYPQVTTYADAVPIDIRRGENRDGIDFVLATRRTFRIAGDVTGGLASQRVTIELHAAEPYDPRAEPTATTTFRGGQAGFGFSTVPPGRYVLRALSPPDMEISSHGISPLRELPGGPTLWAEIPVTVEDRDVDVALHLRAGSRITGRVEFDGKLPVPSLETLQQWSAIVIERADSARVDFRGSYVGDGRFSTIQLVPGRYVFFASPPRDWRLKSVVHEGRDIRDYPFEMGSADIRNVVITFTDRRSAIRGRVSREAPYETTRGWVTIFPSDRALWSDYGNVPRRIAFVELGRSGVFEAEVPPGTYLMAATAESTRTRITADTLTRLAAFATPVVVGDGETVVQDLRLRSLDRR